MNNAIEMFIQDRYNIIREQVNGEEVLCFHFIPENNFINNENINFNDIANSILLDLQPFGADPNYPEVKLQNTQFGTILFANPNSYVQTFNNSGSIESTRLHPLNHEIRIDEEYLQELQNYLQRTLDTMQNIGIDFPIFIKIAFLNINEGDQNPNQDFFLNEIIFTQDMNLGNSLIPIFTQIRHRFNG